MLIRTALGAGVVANSLPALAPVVPLVAGALGVPTRMGNANATGAAITFDDGPHPQGTPAVLETLAARGARATFFLVGEQVELRPSLAAEIASAGHEIALHCHRHRNLLRLTPGQIRDDLDRAAATIELATGIAPRLHRPPYGIYSAFGLAAVRRQGLRPLLWSRWGRDWATRATPTSIFEKLTSGLTGGDVLLLHDADHYSADESWRRTAAALPRVLDEIERRGLTPVAAGQPS